MPLPEGFVLDSINNSQKSNIPDGFVLDNVARATFPEQASPVRKDRFVTKASQDYDSYGYVDAAKDTGKIIANSLADLGENTVNTIKSIPEMPAALVEAVKHPIRTGRTIIQSAKNKIGEYNSMDKFADKVSTDPLGFGSDVVGAVYGAKSALTAGKPVAKTVIKSAKGIPEGINKAVSPIRDYAGNKVTAIRSGAKQYWKDEVKAYGDAIDSMAGNTSKVPSSDLMQKLTKTMVDRKLYDPLQQRWVTPLNKVDAQLIKSYQAIAREIDNGGNVDVSKVIREYQNIRDSVPIDSPIGRDARIVANDVIAGIKNHIDVKEFKAANKRYADFRSNFDAIDRKVDVWGNPIETGRGERFLTENLSNTKESRLIAKAIEKKTGTTLKGAKAINVINNLPGMRLIKRR